MASWRSSVGFLYNANVQPFGLHPARADAAWGVGAVLIIVGIVGMVMARREASVGAIDLYEWEYQRVAIKRIVSNMAGVVLEFLVQPGDQVAVDQDVVMLELMKMQIPVQATAAGTVITLKVNEGDFVDDGDILLEVD